MTAVSAQIDVIVGLGNPGPDYSETRHNAGFWFLDCLAGSQGRSFSREPRFFGDVCKVKIGERAVRLIKPMGFMNRSGQAVLAAGRFYRCEKDDLLVVLDDTALPLARSAWRTCSVEACGLSARNKATAPVT